jgi:DNA-binding NarL/FixJ family response regulator
MTVKRSIAVVADDHDLVCASLAEMLRCELGFTSVIETGSFDDAVEQLGRAPEATLALFDLDMPGMHGAASLQSVREVFPAVRVAVITASTRRDDILLSLTAGVHGYVPKTLGMHEIAQALSLVLDGKIFVPPCVAELPSETRLRISTDATAPLQALTIADLTLRQREVLHLMAAGKSNKEIARALHLATGTIKVHVNSLFRTLGVHNRVSAVAAAQANGS